MSDPSPNETTAAETAAVSTAPATPGSIIDRAERVRAHLNAEATQDVDFLRLLIRFEEWRGRPATASEAEDFAYSVMTAARGVQVMEDIIDDEYLVVPLVEGHINLTMRGEKPELLRRIYDLHEGRLPRLEDILAAALAGWPSLEGK